MKKSTARSKTAAQAIVCFGDSLTEAGIGSEGEKWPNQLQWDLESWRPGRYRIFNRGIGGNTTANALDRIEADVLSLMPGWVVVEFGGNDCNVRPIRRTHRVGVREFESNLREIGRMITAAGGKVIFLAVHLLDPDRRTKAQGRKYGQGNGRSYAENYGPYLQAIRKVSKAAGAPLIDLPKIMARKKVATREIVINDGVHLSPHGNDFYAREVAQALKSLLD